MKPEIIGNVEGEERTLIVRVGSVKGVTYVRQLDSKTGKLYQEIDFDMLVRHVPVEPYTGGADLNDLIKKFNLKI